MGSATRAVSTPVRVTQDLYISPDGDLFERFYRAPD
jgi:hypothetical protein